MKHILIYIYIFISSGCFAQQSLEAVLKKYNDQSIPYIFVNQLQDQTKIVLLDAREPKEYNVSHINNAIFVGYKKFQINNVLKTVQNKHQKIVVYCSLGVRSESIAKKIKAAGYTNVYNLYGGIFEWKNNNLELYNSNNQVTENVHAFSKQWGKWLTKGKKIYD